jgi:uncharacterized protein (TIGR02246 family)
MVRDRETAMKNKDLESVMKQFSDDATWINSEGFYYANKKEIETFHYNLTHQDSIGYHYLAGKVKIRMVDNNDAIVNYPWRMDWFNTFNPSDTLEKEVGLMTLSAQKRNEKWWWIAVTNQYTPVFFNDLTKHKSQ